ncbi:MAG: YggS family pyridoxal phosphate-dependent enzyme [Acidimicrobiales bacterium]|nr:YggS family pyridoxal phosphate-dependent enzyme [Acidimicrobiales bacterium]
MPEESIRPPRVVRDAETLRSNLADVRARIAAAAEGCGRDPSSVRLLPVSKTVHDDRIAWLADAGVDLVGENKVQEALGKADTFERLGLRWAMIGHLQTNKVRHVVGSAAEVHSVDNLRVAEALDRRLQDAGSGLDVFVQVNSSGEDSKFGLPPDEVEAFVTDLAPFTSLRIRGLMTLAVFSEDRDRVAACFERMRALQERLRQDVDADRFAELSMGMSGDFELAIEYGATTVRVGEGIFGPRHTGPDDYWPGVTAEQAKH